MATLSDMWSGIAALAIKKLITSKEPFLSEHDYSLCLKATLGMRKVLYTYRYLV